MIIDQLSPTIADNLSDEVPVEQGQLTFKTTWQKVLNLFLPNLHLEDYLRKDGTTVNYWNSSSYDLDNLKTGIVLCSTRVANTPQPVYGSTVAYYLVVGTGGTADRIQIAIPWTTDVDNNIKPQLRYIQTGIENWSAWSELPFLLKKGGTMTGNLIENAHSVICKSSNLETGRMTEAEEGNAKIIFRDKDSLDIGFVMPVSIDDPDNIYDFECIQIGSKRLVGSSYLSHVLSLGMDAENNPYVGLNKNAWLEALGLTTTSTSTVSNIISVNTSNATISSAQYVQNGKIAQVRITWTNRSAITVPASGNIANLSIGSMVSGKRPAIDYTGAFSNGDSGGPAWYTIADGGAITLRACESTGKERTIDSGTTFIIFATYILP